jgi:4-amino-4-deoxy-L-arabinose transferase-like glycosyltransferase
MIERKGVRVWEWGGAETRTLSHTPVLLHPLARVRISGLAAAMVLAAIILRIIPWLTNYPLHRDEALYGYWAQLVASGRDPLLLSPWVDKPPLVIYLLAADIRAFGASELALRLPGLIASLLLVLVTFGFARRAYGVRVALIAGGVLTLSPFAILFAPTAFTDPWLALWLVAAAWAALARRPFLAGLLLGLAVASKQQGVLGVPLVFALLMAQGSKGPEERRRTGSPQLLRTSAPLLLRSILGFALIFAPVTCWDSLRWVNRPSFWDRSVTTYGQLTLVPLAEWPQRAADWATQIGYLFGLPVLGDLMLLIAAAVGVRAILPRPSNSLKRHVDVILALYTAGYLALHFAATFQPWDRYLLPILPWICVLAARGLVLGWKGFGGRLGRQRTLRAGALLVLVPVLLYAAWLGAASRLPVGSDHGAYAGLDQAIATLRKQPADAIIYDRWLGWHYDFYLFSAPQERRWWGSGWKLADDAADTARTEPARTQWVVLPDWETSAAEELQLPLASRGLALVEVRRIYRPDNTRSFTLYRIIPLRAEVTP